MSDQSRHTLLLRLAGPLQSWGTSSRYTERDTGYEPSKSGVIGLLAASLGIPRNGDLSRLAILTMGIRVDREGVPGYDFQSAGAGDDHPGIAMAKDSESQIATRQRILAAGGTLLDSQRGKSSISRRYFLQDAVFLVGLEGDDLAYLTELDAALRAPVYPIGLGRRSYVPSVPVAMPPAEEHPTGVRENTPLIDALNAEPWPVARLSSRAIREDRKRGARTRRLVLEDPNATDGTIRIDQPIGAAFSTRVFGPRIVAFSSCEPVERGDLDAWL
ncbi:MAG: type I-E CRISPR-associated protein Cas5/CasD [Thermomicrobiales bacterium]